MVNCMFGAVAAIPSSAGVAGGPSSIAQLAGVNGNTSGTCSLA
jgi:hypothetical protein